MGWGIYKQPDGKYAVWSSIVDDFVYYDGTADEIRQVWNEEYGRSGADEAEKQLAYADGTRPRPSVGGKAPTFTDRLRKRDRTYGDPEDPDDREDDADYEAWLTRMREVLR